MKAAKIFMVRSGGIRVKVRLLPTAPDVHREYQRTTPRCVNGGKICGFFVANRGPALKYSGTIVLPLQGKLTEWVPHEVTHAVIHALGGVLPKDDEDACYAIGRISAQIIRRIEEIRRRREQ